MNKIKTTAGLLALGAVSVHAAVYAPSAGSPQATKPWSVSATLRGFYDDNYSTVSKEIERDSFGFEISPSASLNLIRDQTTVGLNYVYSMRWYEDRESREDMPSADHAHQFNAKLSHAFTPRYKVDVSDSFVIAQEPTLIDEPGTPAATFLRSDGDNMRNTAMGSFSIGITEETSLVLGYSNQYYNYENEGDNSRSAFLDRLEHLFSVNVRHVLLPKTVLVGGYQYEIVDYSSEDAIGNRATGNFYNADERDSTAHYFYLGVDQGITATLNASLRAGVQYTEYDNFSSPVLANYDDSQLDPYVDANATWLYMEKSYAQLGFRYQRAQTDVGFVGDSPGTYAPNMDAQTATVYASVNHHIYGGFMASFIGQYQNSAYETDVSDNFADDFFMAGVNLTYEINKWVAAEAGYNYDRLDSEMPGRSYTRNRVYIGIRGTY